MSSVPLAATIFMLEPSNSISLSPLPLLPVVVDRYQVALRTIMGANVLRSNIFSPSGSVPINRFELAG
ncbi:MAG: hypothetical protein ACP5O0_10415 [Acidimicrobiales bacterium]